MTPPDLLTSLFETLRLDALLSFVAELGATDAVAVPAEARVVRFHFVRDGTGSVELPGGASSTLRRGELALVPHGAAQVLRAADARRTAPVELERLLDAGALREGVLRGGRAPVELSLLCGYCRFDPGLDHPVLDALPPLIVVGEGTTAGGDRRLSAALRLLALEADRMGPGGGAILARTIEIVFVQAVRAMIERRVEIGDGAPAAGTGTAEHPDLAPPGTGFLAALADRRLARALDAIHRAPERRWTLDALAREAGLSRTAFADAFSRRVGQPPLSYLTRWRMTLARELLGRPGLPLETIAERVGYASPSAFSRRFRSVCGIGPGAFRRTRLANRESADPSSPR